MAKWAGKFDKTGLRARRIERMNNRAGLARRIEPVAIETDQAKTRFGTLEGIGECPAMFLRQIEIVHCPRDIEIAVGIEPVDKADS